MARRNFNHFHGGPSKVAKAAVISLKRKSEERHHHLSRHLSGHLWPHAYCHECGPVTPMGQSSTLAFDYLPLPTRALRAKRAMDLAISVIALVLLAPLMLGIALAIKLGSSGPVLYRSWRVGRNGKLFLFLKFRTMIANAEEMKEHLQHLNEREGLLFKISNDPRVTRFGRLLRRYSLDELPQLVNVLKGEMSLVGPRPPSLDEYKHYTAEEQFRLAAKPGITGLWQITARKDPSFTTALNLDRCYIESWSPWLDLKILLKTMPVVLQGDGQ